MLLAHKFKLSECILSVHSVIAIQRILEGQAYLEWNLHNVNMLDQRNGCPSQYWQIKRMQLLFERGVLGRCRVLVLSPEPILHQVWLNCSKISARNKYQLQGLNCQLAVDRHHRRDCCGQGTTIYNLGTPLHWNENTVSSFACEWQMLFFCTGKRGFDSAARNERLLRFHTKAHDYSFLGSHCYATRICIIFKLSRTQSVIWMMKQVIKSCLCASTNMRLAMLRLCGRLAWNENELIVVSKWYLVSLGGHDKYGLYWSILDMACKRLKFISVSRTLSLLCDIVCPLIRGWVKVLARSCSLHWLSVPYLQNITDKTKILVWRVEGDIEIHATMTSLFCVADNLMNGHSQGWVSANSAARTDHCGVKGW